MYAKIFTSGCWNCLTQQLFLVSDSFLKAVNEGLGPLLLWEISLVHNCLHICPWLMLCLAVALCDIWSSSVFCVCCYFQFESCQGYATATAQPNCSLRMSGGQGTHFSHPMKMNEEQSDFFSSQLLSQREKLGDRRAVAEAGMRTWMVSHRQLPCQRNTTSSSSSQTNEGI